MANYYNIYDIIYYDGKYLQAILNTNNEWEFLPKILIVKNKQIYIDGEQYPFNELHVRLLSAFQRRFGGWKYIDY